MASKFCKILFPKEDDAIAEIPVEILWWGQQLVYERDNFDKIINTLSVTVVFCREIASGGVVAVDPERLQFEPEVTNL